jgi:hypothetical protein
MGKKSRKKRHSTSKIQAPEKKPVRIPLWDTHPDAVALGLFVLILVVFFFPLLFGGKTLLPPDNIAARSFQPFRDNAIERGIYPLWNPHIFCGMPSFASLTKAPYIDVINVAGKWIISVFKLILPFGEFARYFFNYFLLGFFIYLLLRKKNISAGPALYTSLAMVLLPQVIAYAAFGHSTKLNSAALIPLIFLLAERLLKQRNLLYFSLTGLAVGLQLLRLHTQICFYTLFMVGLYFVYWAVGTAVREKNLKKTLTGGGLLIGAVLLGFLLSSVLYMSVYEYAQFSIRGGTETGGLAYSDATAWSFSPAEIVTYLIPSFMGFGRNYSQYWGPMPFTDFPLYFGIVTLMLAGLALVLRRNRTTWFLAGFSVIALLISFGKHLPLLYGPMFRYFPFFSKFRAPKMIQIMLMFSVVVLAGYGIQAVMDCRRKENPDAYRNVKRYFLIFGGILLALLLFLYVARGAYTDWAARGYIQKIQERRLQLNPSDAPALASVTHGKAVNDGIRSFFLFFVSMCAVLLAFQFRNVRRFLPFILIAFLLIDVLPVSKRFMDLKPEGREKAHFAVTGDVQYLKRKVEQEPPFRIHSIGGIPTPDGEMRRPNWYMYHFIQTWEGYQGAKVRVYDELLRKIQTSGMAPSRLFQLMNVRYLVGRDSIYSPLFRPVYRPGQRFDNWVYEYMDHLPRAYFPDSVWVIRDKESILNMLTAGRSFEPAHVAILETEPPFPVQPSDSNRVRITRYDIHEVDLEADVAVPSIMVLSDIYYPAGWKAYVNGEETEIYKTNYAFRSIFLKPGRHQISFRFRPRTFFTGLKISAGSAFLLLAGTGFGLWRTRRRKRAPVEGESE